MWVMCQSGVEPNQPIRKQTNEPNEPNEPTNQPTNETSQKASKRQSINHLETHIISFSNPGQCRKKRNAGFLWAPRSMSSQSWHWQLQEAQAVASSPWPSSLQRMRSTGTQAGGELRGGPIGALRAAAWRFVGL